MTSARTIYILDDDNAVRRSLERLLSSANFNPIAFAQPDTFLRAAKNFQHGCILLDIRLPGMTGLEVQSRLNAIRADLPIIVLTAQGDVQTAVRAMKAGASDFLEKPYSDEALLGAIEAALDGTINSSGRDEIAEAVKRVGTLSARERDVLEQLIAGRPNKLIAYYLGITVRTVEVHRARMMERLVVRQSADVIRLGVLARLGRSVSGRRPKG